MELLQVKDITKVFPTPQGEDHVVLEDVNFSVNEGEFISLLGPSGCGKTTLLTMIGGFQDPTSGAIFLDGNEITGPSAEKGYVFQNYALFPWMTVETVVLLSKGEVDSKKIRVEFSLEDMDMSEFQDGATYPQIKEYVLEHTGLKVSNLYISQIKRKCGIGVGKNYNLPKSEDSRQPQCPQEKEKAIREAFKYFGMI